MRIIVLLFSCSFVFAVKGFAQSGLDTIQIKNKMGTTFLQNGKKLTVNQLLAITQANPESYKELKRAKTSYSIGNTFAFAGGALIGWQLGASIGGRKANWTAAGIGGGLIVAAIPFSAAFTRHAKHAVLNYNAGLNRMVMRKRLEAKPGFTANGLSIIMNF